MSQGQTTLGDYAYGILKLRQNIFNSCNSIATKYSASLTEEQTNKFNKICDQKVRFKKWNAGINNFMKSVTNNQYVAEDKIMVSNEFKNSTECHYCDDYVCCADLPIVYISHYTNLAMDCYKFCYHCNKKNINEHKECYKKNNNNITNETPISDYLFVNVYDGCEEVYCKYCRVLPDHLRNKSHEERMQKALDILYYDHEILEADVLGLPNNREVLFDTVMSDEVYFDKISKLFNVDKSEFLN